MQNDQAAFPERVDRQKRVRMQGSEVVDGHVRRSPEWQLDNVLQKDSRVQLFSPHGQFRLCASRVESVFSSQSSFISGTEERRSRV